MFLQQPSPAKLIRNCLITFQPITLPSSGTTTNAFMNDIVDFFKGLFATNKWPARWHCGEWTNFHGWLYIISDLMIWTAYFLIPVIIINYFSKKRATIKFQKVYVLFATFILLCGSTHLLDAMMFWIPMYRFNALVRFATGVVSLFTVYYLVQLLPSIFKQRTNTELESEIAKREEAERLLEEANKNLQSFAYIASHDLQEPLRKISTFSGLLLRGNDDMFDDRSKELLNKIKNSSTRMQAMVKDVLTLSTIDEVQLREVNIAEPVKKAIEDLEIKILQKNATINVGDLPKVMGSEPYLTQLFMNLIGNSIKFSKGQPVINITGETNGDAAVIQLEDNGIGMKEEDIKKIFIAFSRLHSRSEYEGSGIGLAICKRIVDMHNGEIEVRSEEGKGSIFTIKLQAATG